MALEWRKSSTPRWESFHPRDPQVHAERRIAIVNGKGGSGKTTTAVNLASCLAASGAPTLLVDMDPQAHASEAVGVDPTMLDATLYDVICEEGDGRAPDRAVVSVEDGLDLLPGGVALSVLEQRLRTERPEERTGPLARLLPHLSSRYRWMVVDTPPSIGLLTLMALRAVHEVIIPIEMSSFSVGAATRLLEALDVFCERTEHSLVVRILPTSFDGRTRFARATLAEVRELAGSRGFDVVIRRNIHLVEAAKHGIPILRHAPHSIGAVDYNALAAELQVSGATDPRPQLPDARAKRRVRQVVVPEPPTFVRSTSVGPQLHG